MLSQLSVETQRDSETGESDDSTLSGKQNSSSFTIFFSGLIPGGLWVFFLCPCELKAGSLTTPFNHGRQYAQ